MANISNLSEEELRKLFNVTKTPTQAANYWSSAGNSVMQLAKPQALQAQAPTARSDAEELERYRQRRLENPLVPPINAPRQESSGSRLQQLGQGVRNFFNESGEHLDMLTETQLQQQNEALGPLGGVVDSAAGAAKDFVLDPNAPSFGESFDRRIADKVSLPEPSPIYQAPANNVESPATTAQTVVPQAPSIFQPLQTQPMPSQAIGQYPTQANQLSQEAAAQVNPILAPQIDQTFDEAQVNVPPSLQNPFATQASQPPQGNGLTTVSGIPLSDFLSGKALPEQGLMRAENPMYGDNSLSRGLGGDAATKAFQDASEAREARIEQNFSNGRAVSDRERRGTGEMSMEAAVRMAGGDRDRARQMIERQRQGRDPVTGEAIQSGEEGMTFEQEMAARRQRLAEDRFNYERVNDFNAATKEEAAAISKIQDAQSRDAMTGKGMKRSVLDMLDVMDNVGGRLDKFWSTDMAGNLASLWKGSEADAQEADFAFLKSNVALKAMMELKAQSSTGATGFGALNTEELKVLTNRFATLDPFTKPEIIRENLVRLRDQTIAMFEDAKIRHAEQYGPEAAEAVYGDLIRSTGGAKGASQQSSVPNDQNVASKADPLLPKYQVK